jgi:hypothetical protein
MACCSLLALGACAGGSQAPDADPKSCDALNEDLGPLLEAGWSDVAHAAGWAGTWRASRAWIEQQLVTHDEWVALGSCALRSGDLTLAERAFQVASERVRHSVDAGVGLGYVALRSGRPGEAVEHFALVLRHAPESRDGREGLGLALARLPVGDPAARTAVERLEQAASGEVMSDGDKYLWTMASRRTGGPGELRRRPDQDATTPGYWARAGADYLEVRDEEGAWRPIFVKGVNIGPARPGRFASEPPEEEATWAEWLRAISALGANAIRVYTLQPPAFYRALAAHNEQNPDGRLWLLQGVWADLPPDDDFAGDDYQAAFEREIARVIDAVHGDLVLDPVRGTARGIFDTDVSGSTLAWIVGREWEPFAVAAFLQRRPGPCQFAGDFVSVEQGNSMECWIGRMLDYAAGYEARRHGAFRPVTFANWPTLDPLEHPTEATRAEEDLIRHELTGQPVPERTAPAWDDDAVSVDAAVMRGTSGFGPGVFAAYHVYPNFPYFMNLDPAYARVEDAEGPLRYAGYLRALKAHHGSQPVLVAEFGMSSSRGIAHVQPEGLHHGGQDEAVAMEQSARLLHAIHDERMAGGVAFEFMDEWFKGTWSTSPFEIPEDHRPRWFNAESPEQSYGLFANRPAAPIRLDGDALDWADLPVLAEAQAIRQDWSGLKSLRATYDAGWVYVLLQTAGTGTPERSSTTITLGLDTYDPDRGERVLPAPADCAMPTGVEFAVTLLGAGDSEVLVTPPYRQRHPSESGSTAVIYSPLQPTGGFQAPSLETNRERYTRDGTLIPAIRVAPGKLRFGSLDPGAARFDTRSDVAVGPGGAVEIRLPWALLNFADPSSRRVLHSEASGSGPGTLETDSIRLYACAFHAGDGDLQQLPPAVLPLHPWVEPDFRFEPKFGLERLRGAFMTIPGSPVAPEGRAGS